jgi:D-threo-aldose 1-dehydrogenase
MAMETRRPSAADGLHQRRIGQTTLWITEIGFGTGSLGGLFAPISDEQGRQTIREALSLGLSYVDTSPFYGYGRSEHIVGDVLRESKADVVLSTKVGRLLEPYWGSEPEREGWIDPQPFTPRYDYSYDGIMRSVAESRQRLGLSRIDMLFVHDIGTMNHGANNAIYWEQLADGGYRALAELKQAGLVGAIGLGVNEWQVLTDALKLGDWDAFLLAQRYTLLEQEALSPLMDACVKRGTSVIVGGVFNGGLLVGGSRWNYRPAPDNVLAHRAALDAFCTERGVLLQAAAIQMPLAHPAVCCVLAGGTSPHEVRQFIDWSRTTIDDAFWLDLASSGLLRVSTPLPGGFVAT